MSPQYNRKKSTAFAREAPKTVPREWVATTFSSTALAFLRFQAQRWNIHKILSKFGTPCPVTLASQNLFPDKAHRRDGGQKAARQSQEVENHRVGLTQSLRYRVLVSLKSLVKG